MTSVLSYGLAAGAIDQILKVFAKFPEVQKVVLYGSRAKGNFRPGSDIDLALFGPKLTLSLLLIIENELDDLLLPQKIDLTLHSSIDNPSLVEHIERVGKVFYVQK